MPPLRDDRYLPGLHGLRGVAACCIVAHHVGTWPGTALPPPAALGWLLGNLWLAVQLFFVLSALCLMHAHYGEAGASGWVRHYAIRRFFRIAPLFYLSLLMWWPVLRLAPGGMLLNFAFLFGLFPDTYNSGVPGGWAIGAEALFYTLFPAAMAYCRSLARAAVLFCVSILASIAVVLTGPTPFFSNLSFFAGGILAFHVIHSVRLSSRAWRTLTHFSVLAFLPLALVTEEHSLATIAWSVPLATICCAQAAAPARWLCSRPLQWIGERSYSLYLLHGWPVIFLHHGGYAALASALPSSVAYAVGVALTLAMAIPLAWYGYRVIERPGMALGRRLAGAPFMPTRVL